MKTKFKIHVELEIDQDAVTKKNGAHTIVTEASMKRAVIQSLKKITGTEILYVDVIKVEKG
jgi:hypothetical protein